MNSTKDQELMSAVVTRQQELSALLNQIQGRLDAIEQHLAELSSRTADLRRRLEAVE